MKVGSKVKCSYFHRTKFTCGMSHANRWKDGGRGDPARVFFTFVTIMLLFLCTVLSSPPCFCSLQRQADILHSAQCTLPGTGQAHTLPFLSVVGFSFVSSLNQK